MKSILDKVRYFTRTPQGDAASSASGDKEEAERPSEQFYRHRWQYDKEVRSTHGVNCTGSCSWRIFVKQGIVTWEVQQTDYPRNRPGMPDHEPRGCPRGASYSWYLYNSGRVKHPLIRFELLAAYREAKQTQSDPVLAWEAVMNDAQKTSAYKSRRGLGGFIRASWDEALEMIAAANIYTIKTYGPDRLVGFTPIPAFSMVSYASGTRYLSLLGGTCLSFYDFYCDLPPSSPQTWGEQTDVPESADWYNSSFIMLWGSNVPVTRTPDAPFLTQVRYKGTKVVVISPDYSDATKFADTWMCPKQGTDSALGMAMGHVVLKEFFIDKQTPYFDRYVRRYSDLPFLVRLEKEAEAYKTGRLLRASDFADRLGMGENAEWHPVLLDENDGSLVVPGGTIGSRWDGSGRWNLKWEDAPDGKPFTPQLSVLERKEAVADVLFPYFGGETYRNPYFKASGHRDILKRKVPVIRCRTAEGTVYCTTVFDLMAAHYGVDRGLGDEAAATSYDDDVPYTPRWQEQLTGVPAQQIITTARQFAENAARTEGRSMIIIGAGVNQWYHTDMTYRAAINLLILCGTVGQSGGGWAHYVGQEKCRPQAGWSTLAFATDWIRPPRHMNASSYFYMHSDQWRYEKVSLDNLLSPLADKAKWKDLTLLDCNIKSQRMGWLPVSPELNANSLRLAEAAETEGLTPEQYVARHLRSGRLALASEDVDNPVNFPRNLFIWRANLIGCSAKGMEYFMKHLLGAQNNVLGKDLQETGTPKPIYEQWHEQGATGKLDLVVTVDYRMTTSSLHSDIVLPAATWYEKNDLSSTDMHPFLHPFCRAVDPVWESRTDWDFYKELARKFSQLCRGHLGIEKDVMLQPLLHDSPGEIAEPLQVEDWKETGAEPVPGKNMGKLVVVERDYPDTYRRYTSLGPLATRLGITAKGLTWDVEEEVDFLKKLNRSVPAPGDSQGLPQLQTDIQAIETILALSPESNGKVALKAWKALEKPTRLDLMHLAVEKADVRLRYHDLVAQPRRVLNSPVWSGLESHEIAYTAGYTNVHELIPWRTLTGRQSLYQDHPWMGAFGEHLALYKPPLAKKEVDGLKERLDIRHQTLTLNLLTPHNKWSIHSTWSDNQQMLTLGRGGPVVWISEADAAKIGIDDNDWVEVFNDNGSSMSRAIVSQRIPEGALFMYHNQERIVNMPLSPTTGHRGGIHNSVARLCPKPTHMIGGYAQLAYGLNYYGTIGANRDEFVILRKCDRVAWDNEETTTEKTVTQEGSTRYEN